MTNDASKIWEQLRRAKELRAAAMPDEQAALAVMFSAYQRLEELGWRPAIYCPKDGTPFYSIEPGSTGIHVTRYCGEWPDGRFFVEEAGDLWPARPALFKPIPPEDGKD